MFPNYSSVRLMSPGFNDQGAELYEVGYIIEVYPDGEYEVEFSDSDGITTAQIVVREEHIQLADVAPRIITDSASYHPGEAPTRSNPIKTTKERLP